MKFNVYLDSIDFLMSKAFTPIVPSEMGIKDVSKISWNRNELMNNISYSEINESILLGRNQLNRIGNTDSQLKKKGRSNIVRNTGMMGNEGFAFESGSSKPYGEVADPKY